MDCERVANADSVFNEPVDSADCIRGESDGTGPEATVEGTVERESEGTASGELL